MTFTRKCRLPCKALILATGILAASAPSTAESTRKARLFLPPARLDAVHQAADLAAETNAHSLAPVESTEPFIYRVLPQAGIEGRDVYTYNYVDLDPFQSAQSILDWDCSQYTYDGHGGHDIMIRGFREQAIGVPVYAAFAGTVTQAIDIHPDDSIDWTPKPNNGIVIDHGGGYRTISLHIRQGSALVAVGDQVVAGQQIAQVGSSGISTGPHLHFETRKDGAVVEPSVGACRAGESLWATQRPVSRHVYLREAYFSTDPLPLILDPDVFWRHLLNDGRARTGSLVKGTDGVYLWVEFYNLPGASTARARVLDPKGKTRLVWNDPFGTSSFSRVALFDVPLDVVFDQVGEWRIFLDVIAGANVETVLDTRLRVVGTAQQAKNRKPAAIKVRLDPPKADVSRPTVCVVEASLTREDPDHDLVSYLYEWRLGSRLLRQVHSAALTDILPAGAASAKDRLRCRVRPHDGKAFGPAAEKATTTK